MKITIDLNARFVLRWLLGVVFIWAALSKLGDLQDFYTSLAAYRLPLPDVLLRLSAIVLPWLEFFCGLMLLTEFWFHIGLIWVVLLCGLFAVCTGQAWARGLEISCGCMNMNFLGPTAKAVMEAVWFAFIRAILLLAGSLWLLLKAKPAAIDTET